MRSKSKSKSTSKHTRGGCPAALLCALMAVLVLSGEARAGSSPVVSKSAATDAAHFVRRTAEPAPDEPRMFEGTRKVDKAPRKAPREVDEAKIERWFDRILRLVDLTLRIVSKFVANIVSGGEYTKHAAGCGERTNNESTAPAVMFTLNERRREVPPPFGGFSPKVLVMNYIPVKGKADV